MIIGVIGSGGREHSICKKILESKKVEKVYCFPGNAGTSSIATNIEVKINDFNKESSIEEITLDLNIWLEKMILLNPSQWIWSHDRWK